MLHGASAGGWCFDKFRDVFEGEGWTVHTPDLIGHGKDKDGADQKLVGVGLAEYRAEFAAALSALPPQPVILGHSMGAVLAQQLAASGLARALILVSPAPRAGILPSSDSEKDLSQSLMGIPSFWKTVINPDFDLACFYSLNRVPKDRQRAVFDKFGPEFGPCLFRDVLLDARQRLGPPRSIPARCAARCSAFPAPMTILCRLPPRAPQPCHIAMRNSGRRPGTGTCFRRARRRRHRATHRRAGFQLDRSRLPADASATILMRCRSSPSRTCPRPTPPVPGAEEHRSRDPARRDLRAARPERRRQDHADQHHLRHRQRRATGTVTVDGHDIVTRLPRRALA